MKGYDIDGVITNKVIPEKGSVIISGRTFAEYDDLVKQLAQTYLVYIRGIGKYGDKEAAGKFKAMMIKYLKITEFYEDDDVQIKIIKKENPNCLIHKIVL